MVWQFGPYRMEGLIARGGMGEVHRAYDTRHDRVVAVKLLADRAASDQEFRERFKRESQAAARLREPHVIPIHAYGEIDGRLYLDMRLVEGKDLSKTLAERGAMRPSDAVDLIGQVAGALDAAHAEGLVHRDVKPSNIMVGTGGFAYLVDFGIARRTGASGDITGTGDTVGTLAYMAPERFGSQPVDHRVDIYSLACVLFQCLTGAKPFTAENALGLMYSHLNNEPPKPHSVRPDVAEGFDAVIAKGMAKNPAERFASAGELASAARRALNVPGTKRIAPVSVTPVEPVEQLVPVQPAVPVRPVVPQRTGGRRRWFVVAAVVAAAALLGVSALIVPRIIGHNRQTPTGQTTTPAGSSTAPSAIDLGLSTPMSNPECNGGFIVIVGSAVTPTHYATAVQQFLKDNPGSKYLHAPSTGCASLRTRYNGADIYSVFYGPFQTREKACAKRATTGGDSFVRRLDNSSAPDRAVSCQTG